MKAKAEDLKGRLVIAHDGKTFRDCRVVEVRSAGRKRYVRLRRVRGQKINNNGRLIQDDTFWRDAVTITVYPDI